MDWHSQRVALTKNEVNERIYQTYDYTEGQKPFITIDFLKGEHFWNPQVAIWIEDSLGNHLQTLLVTTSTAKGLFYSGRSEDNFKDFDGVKTTENTTPTRRVNALPYWAHKYGVKYKDGLFAPHPDQPLPDGITGATPTNNFFVSVSEKLSNLQAIRVMVEVNVAFDQNEYYSEYDFIDDENYHSGTGLLGQPSVIYGTLIRKTDSTHYSILDLMGHGHHSGSTGEMYNDMEGITTAKKIVDRIVVGVNFSNE